MAKPLRLYWDTCAWIGLLNGEADKRRELELVYGNARNGKFEIWTSTLSMIECRHVEIEDGAPRPYDPKNDEIIRDLFWQSFVKPIPLAVDIADDARRIWRETKEISKYQDAVHVASSLRWNVETMHTYDRDDLLPLTESFFCRNDRALTICYPDNTTDGPLFDKAKQKS